MGRTEDINCVKSACGVRWSQVACLIKFLKQVEFKQANHAGFPNSSYTFYTRKCYEFSQIGLKMARFGVFRD